MNEPIKYIVMSALLHGVLLALVIKLTAGMIAHKDVMIIDFSLNELSSLHETRPAKQPLSAPPVSPQAKHVPAAKMVTQPALPVPVVSSPAAPKEPVAQPVNDVVQAAKVSAGQRAEGSTAAVATASVNSYSRTTATSTCDIAIGESDTKHVHKKYLKEHFNYIRERIMKRLDYPPVARRMEWTGRVVLAFVVNRDGGVHSVHVKESSGYAVLDNSAMDTVKRVAPFPKPPVVAEIVMPVHFRLQ
ncbi:MAG: energy transducer TonB [Desulfuromonadaceae bacterium]|nr:energy transducer TonB [Desulfuromonadaceae bacterium]MDD5106602.1 energy transducer TonB [Desulfuromonadaceae bacterium]